MNTIYEKNAATEPLMEESISKTQWKDDLDSSRKSHTQVEGLVKVLFATNIITLALSLVLYVRLAKISTPSQSLQFADSYVDPWFGEIPYEDVTWEEDKRFVETFPKVFYNQTNGDEYSIWSELYPSGWVELSGSKEQPLDGGSDLTYWGSDTEEWAPGSQAWATTVMHQIHCLGTMKTSADLLLAGEDLGSERIGHFPHCIEYLRQGILCQADLTLEPPFNPHKWPQGTTGWGNKHRCKSWDTVVNSIKQKAIKHGNDQRWIRVVPEE